MISKENVTEELSNTDTDSLVVFQRCPSSFRHELTGGQPETVDDFYWLSAREH